jgi:hypothetical protein
LKDEEVSGVLIESCKGQNMEDVIADLKSGVAEVELDKEMYERLQSYLVEVNIK